MGNNKESDASRIASLSSTKRVKAQKHRKYKFKFVRKLVHLCFSSFGFLLVLDQSNAFTYKSILAICAIIIFFADTIRLVFPKLNARAFKFFNSLMITRDYTNYSSGTFYIVGCLITALIFNPSIAGIGIIFLGIGDFFAALGGIYLKGLFPFKMPFTNKTYIGFLSFILPSSIIAILLGFSPTASIIAALVGAIFEVYPIWDDNLIIPVITSTVIYLFYM